MAKVVVMARRFYAHPPSMMWRIFATPELSANLDHRVTLLASNGAAGSVGSSYEVAVKVGWTSVTQRITVRDAREPDRLEAVTEVKGKEVAVQLAELIGSGSGTDVRWTVTGSAPLLVSGLMRKRIRKELPAWLDAADAAARANG